MKKLKSVSRVPHPGFFRFRNWEDGFVIESPNFMVLKARAKDYRNANGFPVGLQFDDQFEENVCDNAFAGTCVEFTPPTLAEKAGHLAKSLFKWAQSGFSVVSQEVIEARLAICRQCNFYGGEKGLIKVACKKCGCSAKKAFLATEHCPLPEPKW